MYFYLFLYLPINTQFKFCNVTYNQLIESCDNYTIFKVYILGGVILQVT